jgi:hypothetical protein
MCKSTVQVSLSVGSAIVHVMISGFWKGIGAVKLYRDVNGSSCDIWLHKLELLNVKKLFFKVYVVLFTCQH